MVKRTRIPAHPTNFYIGRRDQTKYIVVHCGETGEGTTPAEGMGNWFAQDHGTGGRSSAHQGADTDSICTYVDDGNTAFGAPGVNASGWHLELAGRAGQTASQWDDADSRLILAHGALAAAEAAGRLSIPARWLTDAELRAGNDRGFITHVQASRVLGGTHWDPGPNFPADRFMALVRSHLGGTAPLSEEDDMTPEQAQQLAAARADAYDAHVHAKAAASTAAAARTEAYNAHVWAKHASAQTAALAAVVGALAANPDLTAADVEAAAAAGASRALAEAVIEVNVNIPGETA